jgi:hypothetical protein
MAPASLGIRFTIIVTKSLWYGRLDNTTSHCHGRGAVQTNRGRPQITVDVRNV